MTLVSALEDLQQTTLRAIAGCLRKLQYVAGLRNKEGTYTHWGLIRVHGDTTAEKAFAQAHRTLLSEVLSTPLRNLERDAEQSSELAGVPAKSYLEQLSGESSSLLPPSPGAGSERHLNSVLHALSSLLPHQRPGAIPPA
ncbi:MAG: hypothetical protein WBQ09_06025 [Terriglobales bacterium]|jgi:hypothetical protein